MIYNNISNLPNLKCIYSYFYIASSLLQIIACFCLYPCFYPLFDGVRTFTYIFMASVILLAAIYFFQTIVSLCFNKKRTFLNHYQHIISFFLSLVLLAGVIIYSPLVGHQQDRQSIFIIAEAGFLIQEIIKFLLIFKGKQKIQISEMLNHIQLLMSALSCFNWLLQLFGTLMFVYSIYIQQLVIVGVFLYGTGSLMWGIRTWIYTNEANSVKQRLCLKSKQPQRRSLSNSQLPD